MEMKMLKLHPFKLPLLFAIAMLMLCMQITTSQAARIYNKSGVTLHVFPTPYEHPVGMLTIEAGERSYPLEWHFVTQITLCSGKNVQVKQDATRFLAQICKEEITVSGMATNYCGTSMALNGPIKAITNGLSRSSSPLKSPNR